MLARVSDHRRRDALFRLRDLGYDIPDSQSNFYLIRGDVYGLVEHARVGLIVRPFRVSVRVSVGSRGTRPSRWPPICARRGSAWRPYANGRARHSPDAAYTTWWSGLQDQQETMREQ